MNTHTDNRRSIIAAHLLDLDRERQLLQRRRRNLRSWWIVQQVVGTLMYMAVIFLAVHLNVIPAFLVITLLLVVFHHGNMRRYDIKERALDGAISTLDHIISTLHGELALIDANTPTG